MKYVAPDYELVRLQIKDVFAAYGQTGCPHDHVTMYIDPCAGTEDYIDMDYLQMGWAHGCYSSENP